MNILVLPQAANGTGLGVMCRGLMAHQKSFVLPFKYQIPALIERNLVFGPICTRSKSMRDVVTSQGAASGPQGGSCSIAIGCGVCLGPYVVLRWCDGHTAVCIAALLHHGHIVTGTLRCGPRQRVRALLDPRHGISNGSWLVYRAPPAVGKSSP